MKHRVRGGAADSSRCINQTDYFTQTDFSDAYFNENNIVRIDSGLPQTDALGNPARYQ